MAAFTEVSAKLGLDLNPLEKGLAKSTSMFERFGNDVTKVLGRKLGFRDAFKGIMMGIGIGSVDAIANLIVRPFELGAARAKEMLGLTASLRAIQTAEIGALKGPGAAIAEMRREAKDLNREIEIQQNLVKDLNANPLNFVSPQGLAMLREAENELNALKIRQAEVLSAATVGVRQLNRQTEESSRLSAQNTDLSDARLRNASQLEVMLKRLKFLEEEGHIIFKQEGGAGPRGSANLSAQMLLLGQIRELRKDSREQLQALLVSIGQMAAGGRTFPNGRPRPRSETERIAARGMSALQKAENALMTGQPHLAASMARAANTDLSAAGRRVADAGRLIAKPDSDALKTQLITANRTLAEIKANLAPTNVK